MSDTVHPTALAGWDGRGAEDYEAGRPGYPRAAVALIGAELEVGPGDVVLDLAAGTGKLTRELSALGDGVRVVAVEPVAAMRAQLIANAPGVRTLAGTAEAVPLPDGSVRAVTVAQAFHWFDVPRAAAEIARVLEPGGGLAILRNEWRRGTGWGAELQAFLDTHTTLPDTHGRDWRAELDATGRFTPFTERTVENPRTSDLRGIVYRVASLSFIAALPDDPREELLAGVQTLLRAQGIEDGTPVEIPETTRVRWARRR